MMSMDPNPAKRWWWWEDQTRHLRAEVQVPVSQPWLKASWGVWCMLVSRTSVVHAKGLPQVSDLDQILMQGPGTCLCFAVRSLNFPDFWEAVLSHTELLCQASNPSSTRRFFREKYPASLRRYIERKDENVVAIPSTLQVPVL